MEGDTGRERKRERGWREVGRCDRAQFIMVPFLCVREPRSKRQCEIFREGPGTETPALGDVTQLQCWNDAHRTLLRLKKKKKKKTLFAWPALIFISKVTKQ